MNYTHVNDTVHRSRILPEGATLLGGWFGSGADEGRGKLR